MFAILFNLPNHILLISSERVTRALSFITTVLHCFHSYITFVLSHCTGYCNFRIGATGHQIKMFYHFGSFRVFSVSSPTHPLNISLASFTVCCVREISLDLSESGSTVRFGLSISVWSNVSKIHFIPFRKIKRRTLNAMINIHIPCTMNESLFFVVYFTAHQSKILWSITVNNISKINSYVFINIYI